MDYHQQPNFLLMMHPLLSAGFSVVSENLENLEKWVFFQKVRENLERSEITGKIVESQGKVREIF